jgi:hypothetical protein
MHDLQKPKRIPLSLSLQFVLPVYAIDGKKTQFFYFFFFFFHGVDLLFVFEEMNLLTVTHSSHPSPGESKV